MKGRVERQMGTDEVGEGEGCTRTDDRRQRQVSAC